MQFFFLPPSFFIAPDFDKRKVNIIHRSRFRRRLHLIIIGLYFVFELIIRMVSCCFVRPKIDFLVLFNSLKMECEKLAQEKTEMQRHYVMVSEHHFKRDQM